MGQGASTGTETCGLSREVEQLLQRVYERAEGQAIEFGEEKPALHDLMRSLDSILRESETLRESPPTEVANTVYRLLLKREKQKAYESLVTIQSEIYDLQGKH